MSTNGTSSKRSRETYESCSMSRDERNTLARVALTLVEQYSWSQEKVRELFGHASYSVPSNTLSEWLHRIESTGEAVPHGSGVGHVKLLDEKKQDLLAGFILQKNVEAKEVHLQTAVNFLRNDLGITMTEPAAYHYIADLGFSLHTLKKRKKTYMREREKVSQKYYEWLVRNRITVAACMVCSIDITTTSHRKSTVHGYSRTGATAPDVSDSIPLFTNSIVTCIWADGVNRTPSVLFTYNSLFRRDRHPTAIRTAAVKHLDEVLAEFAVDGRRVVYAGESKGEKRTYCAESPEIIRRFFSLYPNLPKNILIFSDVGNCFFQDGKDVLLELGFLNHKMYEPIFHHYVSPNDNKLHGVAKNRWRERFQNFSDDVHSSIALLSFLDSANEHSAEYFARNFQYGPAYDYQVSRDLVDQLCNSEAEEIDLKLMVGYRMWAGMDGRGVDGDTTSDLYSGLDGPYWQ